MYEKITLSTLKGGALEERFQYELKKVLENIVDPNTEAKKQRKITIELILLPDESLEVVGLEAKIKSTLVPIKSAEVILSMSAVGQEPALFQETSKQFNLPDKKKNEVFIKEAVNG